MAGKMPDDLGTIYFVNAEGIGLTKIGFATNLGERLSGINVGSPVPLELIGRIPATREAELALHEVMGQHRVKAEWYPEGLALSLYCDLGEMVEDVGVARWDQESIDSFGVSIDEAFLTGAHIIAEQAMLRDNDWLKEES